MRARMAFRPSGWETLEDRLVLAAGQGFRPFGVFQWFTPSFPAASSRPAPAVTVGALGDSYTDEYRFSPPALADQTFARNWLETLAVTRGVNFGPFGTTSRGEPRNPGFAYNWARAGATSAIMVQYELPGLTAQVATGQVPYVWIFIGGDDLADYVAGLAAGTTPPSQALSGLAAVESGLEANVTTAVDTLLAASPTVRLAVATLPDITLQPIVQSGLASAGAAGQVLASAIGTATQKFNALVASTAANNPRIAEVDLAGVSAQLAQAGASGSIPFGGITLSFTTPGIDATNFFLPDGIHVGTVVQGIIADTFIAAVDAKFGLSIKPLSPSEIVSFAQTVQATTQAGVAVPP